MEWGEGRFGGAEMGIRWKKRVKERKYPENNTMF